MARLIISSPDGKRGILEITKPLLTIGRGNANDLVLNHSSVSRLHAVIKQTENGGLVVADRGSTNGVRVNGIPIADETPVQDGCLLHVGAFELRVESTDDVAFGLSSAHIPREIDEVIRAAGGGTVFLKKPALPLPPDEDLAAQVRKLEQENFLLTLLYDAGKTFGALATREEIANELISLCFRMEGVERGFVMFFDEDGETMQQSEVRFRKPRQAPRPHAGTLPQINLSRAILEKIESERHPLLIQDLRSDERFSASESAISSGIRSAMCAPLAGKERLFGIVYVDNLEKSDAFTQDELNIFALLASQAAIAMDSFMAQQELAHHAVQRAALERFLSPEVVEMVAANPNVSLGGVNQKVSILFADIRNFTAMSESLAPERVVEILNEYFSRVTDVIFDHGGTLDKFLGDGVMALFGAPISKGNDAANAVRAAVDIQLLITELNRDARARKWPELRVGIGVNTGVVTAGNIGSIKRLDYTVIGDAVNIAARLMAEAAGGQILISDSTACELDETFSLGGKKPVLFKGKTSPVPVTTVRWMRTKAAKT